MGKGSVVVKKWLTKERVADLFNGTVFEGKQVVRAEDLELIETESDILITDKKKKTKERQRYRDIIMKWKNDCYFVILACEVQSKVNYIMPVRNMLYDSLSYNDQIEELWKDYGREDLRISEEEYLSRFLMNSVLIPVITVVFYYGIKPWDGSLDLYGMFGVKENSELERLLKKYVSNYKVNFIDAGNIENVEQFQTDLQKIFGMLKYRGNKGMLLSYMRKNESYFRHVDYHTYHVLIEFLQSKHVMEKAVEMKARKEDIDMCQALEELYQDGVNEGIERGVIILIESAQEFGHTKAETLSKVMEKYHFDEAKAGKMIEEVWK